MNDSIKLRAENLCKRYGNRIVLDDVSLIVNSGECLGIFGESGSGKSVLLKILAGVERADSGTIAKKGGRSPLLINPSGDHPFLTAYEVMWLYAVLFDITRIKRRAAIRELLSLADLEHVHSRRIITLSDGERRRLDLALSLLSPAYILFLDAPAKGLGREMRKQVWAYIRMILNRDQKTIIFTSSDPDDIQFCDRIVSLDHEGTGRVNIHSQPEKPDKENPASAEPLEAANFSLIIPELATGYYAHNN